MSNAIIHGNLMVKNVPLSLIVQDENFMVARLVDTELWYYGFYYTMEKALEVAQELGNGLVFEVDQGGIA